ncbi:hypothetical protein ACOMHN_049418 [Nucella lapillus]
MADRSRETTMGKSNALNVVELRGELDKSIRTMMQCEEHAEVPPGSDGLNPNGIPGLLSPNTCLDHTPALQPTFQTHQSNSFAFIPESFPQPQNSFPSDTFDREVNGNTKFPFGDESSTCFSPPEAIDDNRVLTNSTPELLPTPHDVHSESCPPDRVVLEAIPVADTQGEARGRNGISNLDEDKVPAEGKASSLYTCFDVEANSASSDTIDSCGSDTCLLKADTRDIKPQRKGHLQDNCSGEEKDTAAYTNQIFCLEGKKDSVPCASEDKGTIRNLLNDSEMVEAPEQFSGDDPSEDCPLMAHKGELEETDGEDNTALESLVQQLAELHPTGMVSITVDEVDTPGVEVKSVSLQAVHKPTPEPPRTPFEHSLLYSTESLNAYKLSKQGYSNNSNSLHVQAIKNWQARTMNNINVRSSFRNLASASVNNLGQACRKALSYIRTDMEFSSMMSLGDGGRKPSILTVTEGETPSDEESSTDEVSPKGQPSVASGRHMRNLMFMSLLITIFFVANFATRNLQSSLNQEGGVGVISLAVMFVFYILGSLLSPVMVQGLGVKRCIIGGLVFQLMYVAANLYHVMWLMVPASMGGGASLTLIWNAMSTYVVMLARGESNVKHKSYERVSDRYFGIFCLFYQSNLIVGNLIAALVLSYGDSSGDSSAAIAGSGINSTGANHSVFYNESQQLQSDTNIPGTAYEHGVLNGSSFAAILTTSEASPYDICGADFCQHYVISTGGSSVSQFTTFLLFGIFMILLVVCMFIGLCLLEPLSPHVFTSTGSPWRRVKDQIVSLSKFSRNRKFLLLLPLMLYSVMQYSFVTSELTVAFMTCPIGVWMVGYCMMSYGANCSISSYICQALAPRIGRGFFIALGAAMNIGLLVCLRFWKPDADSTVPVLIIASLFGFCDGIWNVTVNGICGSAFPDHFEEAFTGLRVAQGVGGTFNMAYSPIFCLTVKIYVMMGIVTVVFLGYVGAEILIRREERHKKAVLYEEEITIAPEKEC